MKILRHARVVCAVTMLAACGVATPAAAPTRLPAQPPTSAPIRTPEPVSGDPAPQLERMWAGVNKPADLVWSWRLTPYFPSEWPATTRTIWSRYAYGAARDPRLADGERISAPWARVDVQPGGTTLLVPLTGTIAAKHTQGVFPLRADQVAPLKDAALVEAWVLGLTSLPPADAPATHTARNFYEAWFRSNGAIAGEIGMPQPFRNWVLPEVRQPPAATPRAPDATSTPVPRAQPGGGVELAHGATTAVAPGLILRFASVDEDSRCPTDGLVQCVWSGVATVTLEDTSGARIRLSSIEVAGRYTRTAQIVGHAVTLISVLPESKSQGPRPPHSAYRIIVRAEPAGR